MLLNYKDYKDYEKQVYDWLATKHSIDSTFTFSLRQNGSKGAELDYFIGTEKSKYFSTTFWTLPVGFPGSSGDCIGLIFEYTKTGYHYFIDFNQTASPEGNQNISVLNLLKSLKNDLSTFPGLQSQTSEKNKMFNLRTKTNKSSYESIEEMLLDVEKDLDYIIPLVNEHIEREKKSNPEFAAHRITALEFEAMNKKFSERLIRYENIGKSNEKTNYKEAYSNWLVTKIPQNSGSKSSYIRAIDLLSETLGHPIFEENDIEKMDSLYEDLKVEQRVEGGKYWNAKSTSYGLKGFYSAAIKTYSDFLRDYLSNNISSSNKIVETYNSTAPLNQILYGPPGTGKTYNTVLEAAKIVTGNEFMSYDEALAEFNKKLGTQIEFITFHQNYSYEDFIQGIRPDTENGKELTFEKKDGVFKRIADRALKNLTDSEKPESAKKDFDAVFQDFTLPLIEEDEIEVKMKKTSFYITQISEKSIEFRKNQGDSQHTLSINTLRKMYNDGVNEIILGGLQPYYNPVLGLLLEKGKSQFTPVEKKKFVIIIDEINRANISRVFGELITLIEKDKRSHGKIPMRVTLPSGDSFIVPSNLYIIGTMNTADKSIALLDIALRRRFDFVAKYPEVSLVRPEYQGIFSAINKAILDRKNHDFTIGHAYFMEDDCTIENTINNKVIPLLLEYFMNDEKEVTAILQSAKITIGGWPLTMLS